MSEIYTDSKGRKYTEAGIQSEKETVDNIIIRPIKEPAELDTDQASCRHFTPSKHTIEAICVCGAKWDQKYGWREAL